MKKTVLVRPVTEKDQVWIKEILSEYFGSYRIVSRGKLHNTLKLPGLIASIGNKRIGLLNYRIDCGECEIITIVSLLHNHGIGRKLLGAVRLIAEKANCERVWLITTNDNVSAQNFYHQLGWKQVATYQNAIQKSRKLKPDIPEFGENGIPINDEIEFEWKIGDEI